MFEKEHEEQRRDEPQRVLRRRLWDVEDDHNVREGAQGQRARVQLIVGREDVRRPWRVMAMGARYGIHWSHWAERRPVTKHGECS